MREMLLSEKEKLIQDLDYKNHEDYKFKICAEPLQQNIYQDCYREQLVSFFQMAPLMNKTVPLEEADYILYANPFARVQDFTDSVLEEIEEIDKKRKDTAEIIICGKATNIKDTIKDKYSNITYVPSHYAEYVGKRFEIDMKEEYIVYDDRINQLNIWPVDGCLNKCGFCRRTYMHIPFESQSIEFLKEKLDWFRDNHPEQMTYVSLRAENLNQYGLDIYGKRSLNKVIDLLNSYDEIKYIGLSIGFCIGEITKDLINSLANCNKLTSIALYFEAGSDRLLKLIGKNHTCYMAKQFVDFMRAYHPNIEILVAVMIGLPTEELADIISLGNLLMECDIDIVHCNYYGYVEKQPLAAYPQLTDQVKKMHLKYLINYIKKNYNRETPLALYHETFYDSSKRNVVRRLEEIKKVQKYTKGRIWYDITYEYFMGNDIVVKTHNEYITMEDLEKESDRIARQKKLTKN